MSYIKIQPPGFPYVRIPRVIDAIGRHYGADGKNSPRNKGLRCITSYIASNHDQKITNTAIKRLYELGGERLAVETRTDLVLRAIIELVKAATPLRRQVQKMYPDEAGKVPCRDILCPRLTAHVAAHAADHPLADTLAANLEALAEI